MAYGNKYKMSWNDHYSQKTEVYIQERDYSGAITEVDGGADPLVIRMDSSQDKKENPIKGSRAILSMCSDTDGMFIDLFTSDIKKYKVYIEKDSVAYWTGWLLPDQYNEDYKQPPYIVRFEAVDGLGILKNYDLEKTDGSTLFEDNTTMLDLIWYCLYPLELELNMYESLNIYATDSKEGNSMNSTTADSPLDQAYLKSRIFYDDDNEPDTCYNVLSKILTIFGAQIRQIDNLWEITMIDQLRASYTRRTFLWGASGFTYSTNGSYDPVVDLTSASTALATQNILGGSGNSMMIVAACKKFTIHQDYGYTDNLIVNGDFTEYTEGSLVTIGAIPEENIDGLEIRNCEFDNWTVVGQASVYNKLENPALAITGAANHYTDVNRYVYSDLVYLADSGSSSEVLKISFKYKLIPRNLYADQFNIFWWKTRGWFEVVHGSYWLDMNGEWQATRQALRVEASGEERTPFNRRYDYETFEINTYRLKNSGNLTIIFYEPQYNTHKNVYIPNLYLFTFVVDDVKISLAHNEKVETAEGYVSDINLEFVVNQNHNRILDTIDMTIGDIPDIVNNIVLYHNGIYLDSDATDPTEKWENESSGDEKSLILVLGEKIKDQYKNPSWLISGTIYSKLINFNTIIYDGITNLRYYMIIRGEYHDKYGRWDIEMIELSKEGYILQETGDKILTEAGGGLLQ